MRKIKEISLFCDGSVSKPRFGRAISGWVCLDDTGKEIFSGAKIVEDGTEQATVNVAEYSAVLLALTDLLKDQDVIVRCSVEKVNVYTDSLLIVNQLNGIWACQKQHLIALKNTVNDLERELTGLGLRVSYNWIPREQNVRADELSKSLHGDDFGKRKLKAVP